MVGADPYFLREILAKCPVAGMDETLNPKIFRSFFDTAIATEKGLHLVCSRDCCRIPISAFSLSNIVLTYAK